MMCKCKNITFLIQISLKRETIIILKSTNGSFFYKLTKNVGFIRLSKKKNISLENCRNYNLKNYIVWFKAEMYYCTFTFLLNINAEFRVYLQSSRYLISN